MLDRRLAGLDALRALAIMAVFCSHYPKESLRSWLYFLGHLGSSGVDLFFVLSGFLIAGPLFKATAEADGITLAASRATATSGTTAPLIGRLPLRPYFLKRIFRILPPYFAVLALYFLVPGFGEHEAKAPLWRFVTFTQNFQLDLGTERAFSHAWSLCVEEHFYILVPLILYALRGRKVTHPGFFAAMSGLLVGELALRAILWNAWDPGISLIGDPGGHLPLPKRYDFYRLLYYPTWVRMDGILCGMMLAWVMVFAETVWQKMLALAPLIFVGATAILVVAFMLFENKYSRVCSIFGYFLLSIGFSGWLVSAVRTDRVFHDLWAWPLRKIADLSYIIYLVHKPIIKLFQTGVLIPNEIDYYSPTAFMMTIPVVLAASYALHLLIERPAKKWRDKLLRKMPETTWVTTPMGKASDDKTSMR